MASASGWSRPWVDVRRFVAAFAGVMVVVLIAVGVPLANHLRDVEAERLIAELATRRVHTWPAPPDAAGDPSEW